MAMPVQPGTHMLAHEAPTDAAAIAGAADADDELQRMRSQLAGSRARTLQLECVLEAKDREMTLLRQHLTQVTWVHGLGNRCWLVRTQLHGMSVGRPIPPSSAVADMR